MRPGDRVTFVALWSSFRAMKGTVTSVEPLMVRLDGDTHPIAVSPREVQWDGDEVSMTGAE